MTAVSSAPPVVAATVLDDLSRRLEHFRAVALPDPDGWWSGVAPTYLEGLLRTWRDDYDWRDAEARIGQLPWTVAGSPDAPVRFVHQRTADSSAPVVVLLHGWPDSVLRFGRVLPLLTDLNVLVPALPGYPFGAPTSRRVTSAADMASVIAAAASKLGYDRYVLSAGDVGTDVAESWAATHPDRVVGLHLTDLSHHYALVDPPTDLSAEELAYLDAIHTWHDSEGGYNHLQSTKPNTLAVGLGDSPAGLAAWIIEKLRAWSDCDGDLETVFSRQDVLDWVTAYWVTATIGTSFAPYAHRVLPDPVHAPTVFTMFPNDLVTAPRSFAQRFFDVRSWVVAPAGGHFDAWERPADYANGVRNAIAHRSS